MNIQGGLERQNKSYSDTVKSEEGRGHVSKVEE